VDNLFVFLMLFTYFRVPAEQQHHVLFWGILGALVMRAIFIAAGVALITKFSWVLYFFGAILLWSGIKMALEKDQEVHPEKNPVLKLFRRLFPVTTDFVGGKFFTRRDGRRLATPLMVVLIVVETTDLVFAVDSIPAVLAITADPFIVFTSNVFAILGLRALYFALARLMNVFHHLHYGLAVVLVFVGVKMLLSRFIHIPTGVALGVVGGVLAVAILASVLWPARSVAPRV
jgi:tellurite resistance protein TerC